MPMLVRNIGLLDPLAGFKGPTSKGRGGEEGDGRGREGSVVESKKILKIDPGFSRAAVRREPQCVRALRRHN